MASPPSPAAPRAPASEAVLFQRLRLRLLHNSARSLWRGGWVRVLSILVCSLLIWVGVFLGSVHGFHFLQDQKIPFAGGIVGTLFDFMFLALGILLVFSSGIILYGSLFTSAESTFLLCTPAAADQLFAYKYQGAIGFSSWAFLLLGSPILIAYGLIFRVPWHFYALLPLFFVGFVLLPGSLGALVSLAVVNFTPRRRKHVAALLALLVVAGALLWLGRLATTARSQVLDRDLLQRLVGQFAFAQNPWVPSHWMARGLQAAARDDLAKAGYNLALIWSNGLFGYVVTAWAASRLYRSGYNRLATGGELRRRYGGHWLDNLLAATLAPLDPQTRLLIVKDFRTFRRDPTQWGQVLILTGLLAFYSFNTQSFYRESFSTDGPHPEKVDHAYQNAVSFLNLMATSLLLCAYTGRFIFPMLSLEGRKFWVLGLLPLRRERLLWGKFVFSAVGGTLVAEFLVILSDVMLAMPAATVALHALAVLVVACGLSGLSVGLGTALPNFRESDPSKIAVGFGGTLNLVAGLLFLGVVLGLMVIPWHLLTVAGLGVADLEPPTSYWLAAGMAAGLLLGVAAVLLPLRMGARTLRGMEF